MDSEDFPHDRGRSKKLELAAYFYAKIESGKDSAFRKYESPCSQCKKGVTLEKGVRVKGGAGKRYKAAYTFQDLYSTYEAFESDRVDKAKKQTNRDDIKPDSFVSFLAERTEVCPHSLFNLNSIYWIETIALFDGEMGLNLPGAVDEIPALFFDALSTIRSAKAQVRKEDKG